MRPSRARPTRGRTARGRWSRHPGAGPATGTSARPSPGRTAWRSRWRRRRDRRPWGGRAYVVGHSFHTLRKQSQGRYPANVLEAGQCDEPRTWRATVADTARRRIPEATVARLPVYYRALLESAEHDVGTISSERLARLGRVD